MITKFLLIDDDREDTSFFEESLKKINPSAELDIIDSSTEFMQVVRLPKPRLREIIFLDINMPATNGWECLELLKRIDDWKNVPVILWSDTFLVTDRRRAFATGALCAYEKPGNMEMLADFLKSISSSDIHSIRQSLVQIKQSSSHIVYLHALDS